MKAAIKTDDLISRLASGSSVVKPLNPQRMTASIGAAILAPLALFIGVFGTRGDLALAWTNPVVPFKTVLPLILCGVSATLLLRSARPEARSGRLPLVYAVPVVAALALWVGAFVTRAPEARFAEVSFVSLAECVGLIMLLSVVPTLAALRVMRQGASSAPALTGALAGLTAASGAAAGYSLFCTRDNPLFFITWYGVAILTVTVVAALIGRRWLSW